MVLLINNSNKEEFFIKNVMKQLYSMKLSSNKQPLISVTPAVHSSILGQYYLISTGSQSVTGQGHILALQINIPANINKTVFIDKITGGSISHTTIDVLYNASFAAPGTSILPVNVNLGSSNTSLVTGKFFTGADPSVGGTIIKCIIQTGGSLIIEYDGRLIIPSSTSNQTILIRLINTSNQTNNLSINLGYWEEEE